MVGVSEHVGSFLDESRERLREPSGSLLKIERDPTDAESLATIFRDAHAGQRTSATTGLDDMTRPTHRERGVAE